MLIYNDDRMKILQNARAELGATRGELPEAGFYRAKLQATWDRARNSKAYASLSDFTPERFAELPITTKDALKATPLDFTTVDLGACTKYFETTGTTGRPTPTPRLVDDVIWNVVSVAEAWRALLQPDDRVAVLLPSDIVPVGDLVVGVCEYLDIAHTRAYPFATGIADWDRVATLWQTFQPTVVFVAPGVAAHISRLAKDRGEINELACSLRTLMLLGEVSTPPFRDRLGRWWGATAHDASYGSTETGTLAAACTGGHQHLLPATTYFELTDGDRTWPVEGPGEGRLVVTPLNLYARPLLRVDTGDLVALGVGCQCGSSVPTVQVHGRDDDGVWAKGTRLSARSVETVVYGSADVTAYVLEIDRTGGYARLLLERDVSADRALEPEIARRLQDVADHQLGLRFDDVLFVNALPAAAKSGASQKSWKRSNIRTLQDVR